MGERLGVRERDPERGDIERRGDLLGSRDSASSVRGGERPREGLRSCVGDRDGMAIGTEDFSEMACRGRASFARC